MSVEIREITHTANLAKSLDVIRESFRTVAQELGLTEQNCPAHASFITLQKLDELGKKARFFGLFRNGEQVGFVAMEKATNDIYYLDKLAVLPRCRHQGYGEKLVEFILTYARDDGAQRVSLGMIDEHTVLKRWYKELGFNETGTRKFDHLPFTVCYMEQSLSGQ